MEITGCWTKLHIEGFHNLNFVRNITAVIKSRTVMGRICEKLKKDEVHTEF
jgi:hypothetical protein